jgi:hypothetical protein
MNVLLEGHLNGLKEQGLEAEVHPQPDSWVFIVIRNYPLPDGYSKTHVDLLLKVPPPYPNAALDMFWMDEDLRLASGGMPANTSIEHYIGRNWLRFSWHPQDWHPAKDSLLTFVRFVDRRLAMRN